ncbi:hypothetical protein FB451DRAFT_1435247 [Mycena latifolia]|nr:hypothetical protein FB451DRAFT_1435247 [Mycena latifolia]
MKPAEDLARCIEEFALVDAKPSESWAAYFAQRQAAASRVDRALDARDDEYPLEIYGMVDSAVGNVLASTDLEDAESKAVRDAIFVLGETGVEDVDGDKCIYSAKVLSRIYFPMNPAAVDVCIEYYYRTRHQSVDFYCDVYYRVHNPVAGTELDLSWPEGLDKMHGFHPLAEMGLADMPPGPRWHGIKEHTFGISAAQARRLHRALFGTVSKKGLAGKISVRETLRLLFASVGVALYVATDPEDEDDCDKVKHGALKWEGIEPNARWLGCNIRRVADCAPMSRDAEESDVEIVEYED